MKRPVVLFWTLCLIGLIGLLHISILGGRMMMSVPQRHHGMASVEVGYNSLENERKQLR